MKRNEVKPQYGWFVKNLVVSFSIIGTIGVFLLIFTFLFEGIIRLILTIVGIVLILLFLWPGIGIATLNIIINSQFYSSLEMKALDEIDSPEILDFGCGTGRTAIKIAKAMKNGGHLFGIDIYNKFAISGNDLETINNNAGIEQVDERTTFQYGAATEIPFEDGKFDIVNISSVLHEIHDVGGRDKALDKIYRLLKPNGYLYLGEWNRKYWQLISYMGIFFLVFKSYKYWLDLLKTHRFKIISHRDNNGFIVFEIKK